MKPPATLLVIGICAVVSLTSAQRTRAMINQPFWFDAQFMGRPGSDGTLRIGVDLGGGVYDSTTVGAARLMLPPGLDLVSGETLIRSCFCNEVENRRVRTLLVRPRGPGRYVIRGEVAITNRYYGRDEGEIELTVTVASDTVVLGACRTVREERVRDGQRYRFAGNIMVPVDESERIVQDDILTHGRRASVVRQSSAVCGSCRHSGKKAITWLVCLGRDGRIRSATPGLGTLESDSVAVRLTRSALDRWLFSPARVDDRTVSDCIHVDVPIENQ